MRKGWRIEAGNVQPVRFSSMRRLLPNGALRGDLEAMALLRIVAQARRVPVGLLTHPERGRNGVALARQIAMYLSHVVLARSLSEIGEMFGRDRTTVSHACGRIEDMRDEPAFEAELVALETVITDAVMSVDAEEIRHVA